MLDDSLPELDSSLELEESYASLSPSLVSPALDAIPSTAMCDCSHFIILQRAAIEASYRKKSLVTTWGKC